jgi:hypothetical protein
MTWNSGTGTLTVGTLSTTTLNATAHRILDNVNQSHGLSLVANEDLTSDVSLNITLGGASRNLTITGNTTISGTNTGDQSGGNPTASAGLTAVNGVATTFMRSDGAPAISQAITPTWSGLHIHNANVYVGNGSTGPGEIRLLEDTDNGSNYASFALPAAGIAANTVYILPPDDGNAGDQLTTNGTGTLTWQLPGAGSAPASVDYLIGTANGSLSSAIVVGTTPGGELGGTWASPTLDDGVTVDAWVMGNSTATTPAANDNDTSLATTAYVQGELSGYASDTVTFTNKTLTSPTMTAPVLGTPASGTLTNCTGLPISTGVSGLGTGVGTFLATPTFTNLSTAVTGDTLAGSASTNTFTNKTFDASATGNVLKKKNLPQFTSPNNVDGVGCTINTTSTSVAYGRATYNATNGQATNLAQWRCVVPADWDTSVTPTITLIDMLGGADTTGSRVYLVGYASAAASGTASPTTGNAATVNMAVDAAGASGDVEIGTATLTGWTPTPGQLLVITVARDATAAGDTSAVTSTLLAFEISYGATQ